LTAKVLSFAAGHVIAKCRKNGLREAVNTRSATMHKGPRAFTGKLVSAKPQVSLAIY